MLFLGLLIFIVIIFIQPQEFLPGMMGSRLVALVLGAVGIGWFFNIFLNRKSRLLEAPQNKIMFFLWIVVVISTFSGHWLTYTASMLIEWGKIVLIFILIMNIVDSESRLRKFIFTIVLCALAISLMGISQFYGHDITGLGTHYEGRIRGVGIFDTNQLGYTIAFCVPFAFCLLTIYKNALLKLFFILTLGLYVYCIYLTQSRGGALCLVLTLGLIFIVFTKKKSIKIMGVIFSGIILSVFVAYSSRLSSLSEYKSDESAMNRIYVWSDALSSLKDYLFFGIGKGNFVENFHIAAHNSYVEVISELGMIGLYAWLALFYFSIRNIINVLKGSDEKFKVQIKIFAKGLLISLIAYLFGSCFSSSSYYITLFIIFSLVVALQKLSGDKTLLECNRIRFNDIIKIFIIEWTVIFGIHMWVKVAS